MQAVLGISREICKCIVYNVVRASLAPRSQFQAQGLWLCGPGGGGGDLLFKPQGCMKIMGFTKKEASCWKKWPIWFGFNLQESSLDKTLNA